MAEPQWAWGGIDAAEGGGITLSTPDGALPRLMTAATEASTVFLVRFADAPALRPEERVGEALKAILPEPCAIAVVPFTPAAFAVVITPVGGQPFDPFAAHMLLRALQEALEEGVEIVPLARVGAPTAVQENLAALNELLEMMIHRRIGVQFQPIVSFAAGRVYGYEALMRAPQEGALKRLGLLFQAADRARMVSWLNIACQERCLEMAAQQGLQDYLFLNMDAEGLSFLDEAERSLADRAQDMGIPPERIVLEITERQTVEDFPRLAQYIERLRGRGMRIAIDDAGEGYSSLHTITELRPEFVKISRALIRSIENNGPRRALLTTLTRFCADVGAAVIAEGIETRDELATVLDLGASYGQGYLLGKPADGFKGLRREMRELIGVGMTRRAQGPAGTVGAVARFGLVLPPDTPAGQVARRFERNPDLGSVVLIAEDRPAGLAMRDRFMAAFAADPEAAERPAAGLMDRDPLFLDVNLALEEAVRRAAFRPPARFHDDILLTHADGSYAGVLPIRALLEALNTRRESRARHAHPLTSLPGPVLVESECNARLAGGAPVMVLHAEVRYLRGFNARFGVAQGDEALLAVGRLLADALAAHDPGGFLGHLRGNDFLLLLAPERAPTFCAQAAREFTALLPRFYTPEQVRKGCIEETGGTGAARRVPLLGLWLAGVNSEAQPLPDYLAAMQALRPVRRAARADGRACALA